MSGHKRWSEIRPDWSEMEHGAMLHEDDGWFHVTCACGWRSGPMPGQEDAMDAYGDHREDIKGEN